MHDIANSTYLRMLLLAVIAARIRVLTPLLLGNATVRLLLFFPTRTWLPALVRQHRNTSFPNRIQI